MNFLKKINLGVILIVILAFLLGFQVGTKGTQIRWEKGFQFSVENQEPPPNININFKLFWDTWDLLSKEYFDKKALDPEKLFYGAIQGMVSAVGDPYTVFLTPQQQKSSKEELNGSFEGVGIQLGFNKDKRLVVMTPLNGTPAEKAGIKADDLIVKIDDKDTTGISLPEAVQLIRGPKDTKVELTILREGEEEPLEFSLVRDTIVVKSVELTFKETPGGKKVAVIKLSRFSERLKEEWEAIVSDILGNNISGVILDVRNNPGGYLEGAVFVSSEFLKNGDVVLQENNQGERRAFEVNRKGVLLDNPMVVIINKGSASASEIVAGALQDRNRATIVGEKSFGKGTIQEAQDLEGGTGIHITVAKWLTPNGQWVNETEGLEPDVVVEMPKEVEEEEKKDPQLEKALEILE
ncbi:S41 family peptidase [Candidatus Daviesbacteria bacterium]|nr:S41 family peptidase [Candidatus Daviesbacteria bacterium]